MKSGEISEERGSQEIINLRSYSFVSTPKVGMSTESSEYFCLFVSIFSACLSVCLSVCICCLTMALTQGFCWVLTIFWVLTLTMVWWLLWFLWSLKLTQEKGLTDWPHFCRVYQVGSESSSCSNSNKMPQEYCFWVPSEFLQILNTLLQNWPAPVINGVIRCYKLQPLQAGLQPHYNW